MTLDELLAKLPPEAREIGALYGPKVLQMTLEQAQQWIDHVFLGDYLAAYRLYLQATAPDALAEWQKKEAEWDEANTKNADRIAMQKEIALAVAKALLPLVLVMVGL